MNFPFLAHIKINYNLIVEAIDDVRISVSNRREMLIRYVVREFTRQR